VQVTLIAWFDYRSQQVSLEGGPSLSAPGWGRVFIATFGSEVLLGDLCGHQIKGQRLQLGSRTEQD
jgi:hypothetical protein